MKCIAIKVVLVLPSGKSGFECELSTASMLSVIEYYTLITLCGLI